MSDTVHDDFQRRMEEASLLGADDPKRQALIMEIQQAGEVAEKSWLDALQENEQLRLALRHVQPSDGLQSRLLQIADQSVPLRRHLKNNWIGAAAIVVLLLTAVLIVIAQSMRNPVLAEQIHALAMLAVHDHDKRPELVVESDEPAAVVSHLGSLVSFPVRIPNLNDSHGGNGGAGGDYRLLGGRVCKFDSRPLIYTRWQCRGSDCSLYQVRLSDFDLPREFLPQEVQVPATPTDPIAHRVLVWPDGQCVYALVEEIKHEVSQPPPGG